MAGLMSRFTTLFKVKANKALDRAEDPGETLDYSYQRQLDLLSKVRRGVADVATSRKRVELQVVQLEQQGAKLQDQAEKAIQMNREDLAREALTRKSGLNGQINELKAQHAQLLQSIAGVRHQHDAEPGPRESGHQLRRTEQRRRPRPFVEAERQPAADVGQTDRGDARIDGGDDGAGQDGGDADQRMVGDRRACGRRRGCRRRRGRRVTHGAGGVVSVWIVVITDMPGSSYRQPGHRHLTADGHALLAQRLLPQVAAALGRAR